MSGGVEYLEDIAWFQDLPEEAVELGQAQRFALRKNQVVMSRYGVPAWAFLISGSVLWQGFDPVRGKITPLAQVLPGQFVGPEGWDPGAIAVTSSDAELLLVPRAENQASPLSRSKRVTARARTPANDLPFHAYHMDLLGPFAEAVDVGSGIGHFSQLMAGYSDRVIAIDPSPAVMQLADDRMKALGYQNFEFRLAAAESIPLDSDSADLVGSRLAVHQLLDPEAFAGEARRVLRVGGILAMTDIVAPGHPDAACLLNEIERARDPRHAGVLTKEQLLAPYRSSFEVVATFDTVHTIALNPWLREAGVADAARSALHAKLAAGDGASRAALGIAGDLGADKTSFDSPRHSVILRRTK